jgi:predicted membrane protein
MSKRMQLILGGVVLGIGLLLLLENVLNIDFWSFCWPIGLILLGVFLLLVPRMRRSGSEINIRILGGVKRKGDWIVANEEIWMFVGDIRLDLSEAEIPEGQTTIRLIGFVGDIDLIAPSDAGLSVAASGFLTSGKILGHKQDTFLGTQRYSSEGYDELGRRLHVETLFFVNDLDIRQG